MSAASGARRHLIDLSPLRESPAFARLWAGNAIAGVGNQMTVVAVGLHIYELTGSTFAVAMVGGVALVPMIIAGLYGGMLADAFDRRLVAMVSALIAWGSIAGIAAVAWFGIDLLWPLYVLTCINTIASTIIGTSRQAILPRLLPARLLPAAGALSGMSVGIMVTVGPALAGVLVAFVGIPWTYTVDVILFTAAFLGIATLPAIRPEGETHRPGLRSLISGLSFLRRAPNIRASYLIDIIAMTFGRPHSLFPAVAAVLLGGGAITVGILTAAVAVGTMISSLFSGSIGAVRRHGLAIGYAVITYGASILAFGIVLVVSLGQPVTAELSGANWLAIGGATLALLGAGAADNVSMIYRNTMLLVAVPDNMRGRMQGIFTVVVSGGPRVGDLYIGLAALGAVLWFPPVLGGLLIIALAAVLLRFQPTFRHYDALEPTP
ncbi:MFS transporter [Terrimesophilobacter mesophilus]|uniref:MFS transporter n=1 Tax=Terrimesophilobacter mesophilus TaxID=433647 RepID=A0A4R8V9C2_9MICO|nr:MFS transporter [Terrimesophilobacter mesophilus]TFB79771.1 MFS transporter [Terrimesophilobacter mesophilus]